MSQRFLQFCYSAFVLLQLGFGNIPYFNSALYPVKLIFWFYEIFLVRNVESGNFTAEKLTYIV